MRPALKFASLAVATLATLSPFTLHPSAFSLPSLAQTAPDGKAAQKALEDQVLQQCRQDLDKNQYEAAVKSCDQALATFRQLKNPGGEVKALNNVGIAYNSLGNYPKAIAFHEQSLAIARTLKDQPGEARSLLNLSRAYLALGNRAKAVEFSQQVLAIAKDLKNPDLEKAALQVLDTAQKPASSAAPASPQKVEADRLLQQGFQQAENSQFQAAKQSVEPALTLYQQIQDRPGEGYSLALLGLAYGGLGNNTKAVELSQKALTIARELKDAQLEKLALGVLDAAQKPISSTTSTSPQKIEADRLFAQGSQQYQADQVEAALRSWEQALVIYQKHRDRPGELVILGNLGSAYARLSNYGKAIELYKQRLAIAQELKDPKQEGTTLGGLVAAYTMTGDYGKAIWYGEQYLAISQKIKYDRGEIFSLAFLGNAYLRSGDYGKAITFYERYLAIARKIKDRKEESAALSFLFDVYKNSGDYGKAIQLQEQVLAIAREIKDRKEESAALRSLGILYLESNKYLEAIKLSEKSLAIAREIKDRKGEGNALDTLGRVSKSLGNYSQAITYQEQALVIQQELKSRDGESTVLNTLGSIYNDLRNSAKAIEYFEQSLAIAREIKDRQGEGNALGNLGTVYQATSNYAKAIEYYRQHLSIAREIQDRKGERNALGNLGSTYLSLGNSSQSIDYYKQELTISHEVQDREGEGHALTKLGAVYFSLGNYAQAIEYNRQGLAIARKTQDRKGEGISLNNLGASSLKLKNYPQAMSYFEQFLAISREIKDRLSEGIALGNLGAAYANLSNYDKAIEYLEQYLAIARETKAREYEGKALSNLGEILQEQQKPELAIVFYKQSVNVSETIRQDIRTLDRALQTSYTETVAGTYRALAELLISQGRIGEAQRVLERLKLQELNDFTKGTRAPTTVAAVGFSPVETQVKSKYSGLIAFGGKYYDCDQQQPRCPQYSDLKTQYQSLSKEFQAFVEQIKLQLRDGRLSQVDKSTQDFLNSADRLVTANPNSILIYPLVLPDKTRLLWASKGGVLSKTATCPLGEKALYSKVSQFQDLISKRGDETKLKAVGKELYECLVKPIESELTANGIKHLIFVPDRATNYIPMGALFDGNQYLIQRFAISTVLSASLTDTDSRLPSPQATSILALGLSQAKGNYSALPNVEAELKAIVKQSNSTGIYPGTIFLNQQFTKAALEDNIRGNRIIHIATHGEFKPENPRSSYFLLGNGTPYPIPDVQTLRDLKGVDLVVLSACKTGLGGADGLGLEVSGISSFFMGDRDRAKAVMASLWDVNDASTSLLMQQFYQNLFKGMSKATALQTVQQAFIQGKLTSKDAPQRSGDADVSVTASGDRAPRPANFSHPYYWAPFILIGNSL